MESVVSLDHVWRTFGTVEAVADVSFDVERGEVFGLLGHNGAGKTTIIRLVNGLLEAHRGTVRVFGRDPVADGDDVRRRTGVLTTYPALDEYLSPAENLAVYAAINGVPGSVARERSRALLTRLGLDPASRAPARGLSAGLKQRVALARALIHDPEVLLLDEPTANLDPLAARGVRDLVRELAAEGRTIIFSTHNLAEAEQLCDRVAILRSGRMVALGSLGELAAGRLQPALDLQVAPGHAARAAELLDAVVPGRAALRSPAQLHVTGTTTDEVARILRLLVQGGVDVEAAVPVAPSLEDVYLAVHHSLEVT